MVRRMLVVLALGCAALVGCGGQSEEVKQAVAACKSSVQAAPQLKADTVSDLEEICEKAGDGDEEDVKKAFKDVCVKIVEDTAPASAQAQLKQSCEQTAP